MDNDKTVFIVDDDDGVRHSLKALLQTAGLKANIYHSARALLSNYMDTWRGCILSDMRMPDMDGLQLHSELVRRGILLPVILMTGYGDVPMAVEAMRRGIVDFIEKPLNQQKLLDAISRAFGVDRTRQDQEIIGKSALRRLKTLTPREVEVLELIVDGKQNKMIAYKLGISIRTVEAHRAKLMDKMEVETLSELVRIAMLGGLFPLDRAS